jgi:hypothetical protein
MLLLLLHIMVATTTTAVQQGPAAAAASSSTAPPPKKTVYCDPTTKPPENCPPITPGAPGLPCPHCGTTQCPCPSKPPPSVNLTCVPPGGDTCAKPGGGCQPCCKSYLATVSECVDCAKTECGSWVCNTVLNQHCAAEHNNTLRCGQCVGSLPELLLVTANCSQDDIRHYCAHDSPTPAPSTRFNCNHTSLTCEEATNGTYSRLTECQNVCMAPKTKFNCDSKTHKCVESTEGKYPTLDHCNAECVIPDVSCFDAA